MSEASTFRYLQRKNSVEIFSIFGYTVKTHPMNKRSVLSAAFLLTLLVSACGNSGTPDTGSTAPVSGARSAVEFTVSLGSSMVTTVVTRPPALLSIYVNMLLADGLAVPVNAARAGIDMQLIINAPASEQNLDNSYDLLEEFASILHVNVTDMLNRSADRPKTLDEYSTGLGNITERSRRRNDDLKQQLKDLKVEERDRRKEQTAIEREVNAAVKANDFGTAGAKQQELIEAQERVTRVSLQTKEVTALQSSFENLLEIADARIKAIDSNREILIAGLRAVDVPGVEDLNVIEGTTRARRTRGSSTIFGSF
jgi:hypothetical protein